MQLDEKAKESRRQKLLAELQERVKNIQFDIARLESQIITATEEKQIHEEDLQFHLQLIDELGGFEEESETEESVELIPEEHQQQTASGTEVADIPGAAEVIQIRKPTRAEIQEQKDKARAWYLDRIRLKR
jgi:hypothetical protein